MQLNLKVKILKKTQDASFPEHIIVERRSTNEIAHLYFDKKNLVKLTHIVRIPRTKTVLDSSDNNISELLPKYTIRQNIIFPKKTNEKNENGFFSLCLTSTKQAISVGFKSYPGSLPDFFVGLDLDGRYKILDSGVAEVKEVYHHQDRNISPKSTFFVFRKNSPVK